MDARRHGQEGALAPPPLWKYKVFLCISGYSKTLSRRIIYALFSQPVVGFVHRPPGAPSLHGSRWGTFVPIYPLFAHPWKKSCGAYGKYSLPLF